MSLITILLFFVYCWGLGYAATKFFRNSDIFLERNLVRIGIGLGTIPFLGVLINFFRIPIDWRIFLALSLLFPILDLARLKRVPQFKFSFNKSNAYIAVVLILFFATLYMYASGSFKYPWLEDDDSWHHASGIKYVALEKDVFNTGDNFMYINPYPPGYDMLFGILHQTSPSLYWTMKFFNALIISLGIIFFYFFALKFTSNKQKALFSTFIFVSIPCYLSHFIWAHALAVTLFFPAMYCIEMMKEDRKWMYAAMIGISGICLTQPTKMIKFAFIFAIYFIIKSVSERKFDYRLLSALFGGYILSIIWWYNHWKPMFLGGVGDQKAINSAASVNLFEKMIKLLPKVFAQNKGSATRAYTWQEIIFAKPENMINNPIGIGIVIFILVLISLFLLVLKFKKLLDNEHNYLLILVCWAVFTFLLINSVTFNLPFGFFGFRVWMLFAIPAAMLAAEGAWLLSSLGKSANIPKFLIILLLIVGVIFTSAYQKYAVNTAMWPFGSAWTSYEEVTGYSWLKDNLPLNTKIFAFTNNNFVIGFDMYSCIWCKDINDNRDSSFNYTPTNLNSWLKSKEFEYLIIDGRTAQKFGTNQTNMKIQELLSSGLFSIAKSDNSVILMKIR